MLVAEDLPRREAGVVGSRAEPEGMGKPQGCIGMGGAAGRSGWTMGRDLEGMRLRHLLAGIPATASGASAPRLEGVATWGRSGRLKKQHSKGISPSHSPPCRSAACQRPWNSVGATGLGYRNGQGAKQVGHQVAGPGCSARRAHGPHLSLGVPQGMLCLELEPTLLPAVEVHAAAELQ